MINLIIKRVEEKLSKKQKEWLWFVALWCLGASSVAILAYVIRTIMGID